MALVGRLQRQCLKGRRRINPSVPAVGTSVCVSVPHWRPSCVHLPPVRSAGLDPEPSSALFVICNDQDHAIQAAPPRKGGDCLPLGMMPSDCLFPSLLTFPTSSGYSHDSKVRAKKKKLPRGLAHEGGAVDVCSDFSQVELLHIPKPSSDLRFSSKNYIPPPCLNSEPVRFTACFSESLWSPQPTHSNQRVCLAPVLSPQSQALQHTHGRPSVDTLSAGPIFGFWFVWTVQHGLQDLSSSTKDGTLARCGGSVEGCPRTFQGNPENPLLYQLRR